MNFDNINFADIEANVFYQEMKLSGFLIDTRGTYAVLTYQQFNVLGRFETVQEALKFCFGLLYGAN